MSCKMKYHQASKGYYLSVSAGIGQFIFLVYHGINQNIVDHLCDTIALTKKRIVMKQWNVQ